MKPNNSSLLNFIDSKSFLLGMISLSILVYGLPLFGIWQNPTGFKLFPLRFCVGPPLFLLVTFVLLPISFARLIYVRKDGLVMFLGCLIFSLVGIFSWQISPIVQKISFQSFLAESENEPKKLLSAIERFQAEKNRPPESLSELIPEYIFDIPQELSFRQDHINGHFRYFSGEESQKKYKSHWALELKVNVFFLDDAYFVYKPDQDYPEDWEVYGKWGFKGIF